MPEPARPPPVTPITPSRPARAGPDRTSLVVRLGLLLLLLLGVASVFGETLLGLVYPPTERLGERRRPAAADSRKMSR